MDIRTIKTFQAIVRTGSFQKASEELQYVQSTITLHIQKLEGDLGVKLLERGKKLRLTEAGRLFLEKADTLLKDYDSLQNAMSDLVNGETCVVRLGVMEPTASYRLPRILAPFLERHPKVQVSIQIGNTTVLTEMLEKGLIDLAVCTTPDSGIGVHFEPLFVEEVALLIPASHPLAEKDSLEMSELQNERLLLTTNICPYRKKLENALMEKGGTPYSGIEIGNMAALKYYVQADFGIAFVPVITVDPVPSGTVVRPIQDLNGGLVTGILRMRDGALFGPVGEAFVETLRDGLLQVN